MAVKENAEPAKKAVAKKTSAVKSAAKRPTAAKRTTVGAAKPAVKKAAAPPKAWGSGRPQAAKVAAAKSSMPPGYKMTKGGIAAPIEKKKTTSQVDVQVVPASKLAAGIARAKDELNEAMESINNMLYDDLEVTEIEVSVSFSADGKFLGFGVGSDLSMKLKIQRKAS